MDSLTFIILSIIGIVIFLYFTSPKNKDTKLYNYRSYYWDDEKVSTEGYFEVIKSREEEVDENS